MIDEAHDSDAPRERARPIEFVELVARVLPVIAVLLPVAGIVTRFVALSFDNVPIVAVLAVDPGLLIATAVLDLVDVVIVLLIAFALARALSTDDGRLSGVATRYRSAPRWARAAGLAGAAIAGVAVLVFGLRYATIPVTLAAIALVVYWQRRARAWGGLTFSRVWTSTAAFFIFAAAMGGLSGMTLPAGFYEFAEETAGSDGYYVEVGRAANLVYLRSCGQRGAPIYQAVNEDHIDRVLLTWGAATRGPGARTIWELLTGQPLELGVRYVCPIDADRRPSY